ncbi:MAG: CBS domain-containing protein [Mariprofundaceae bacterium]|nr:CBS domain-containing protein [Mariprofundaceae bacterium]
MLAERIMMTHLVTAHVDESISDVLVRMRQAELRMLPILNSDQTVAGVVSTFSVLSHIVPDYIVSGDLDQVSYAPDMGILKKHYSEQARKHVSTVMERAPLLISKNESLLSVSASLISSGKHEYALVVDPTLHLLGIISTGDILEFLNSIQAGDANDA